VRAAPPREPDEVAAVSFAHVRLLSRPEHPKAAGGLSVPKLPGGNAPAFGT
jgi:hypothetical protein